jgi:hypothetical protein
MSAPFTLFADAIYSSAHVSASSSAQNISAARPRYVLTTRHRSGPAFTVEGRVPRPLVVFGSRTIGSLSGQSRNQITGGAGWLSRCYRSPASKIAHRPTPNRSNVSRRIVGV